MITTTVMEIDGVVVEIRKDFLRCSVCLSYTNDSKAEPVREYFALKDIACEVLTWSAQTQRFVLGAKKKPQASRQVHVEVSPCSA